MKKTAMSRHDLSDFRARWLRFDPDRPTRPRLLRRFILVLIAMLFVCAALALLAN